MAVDVGITGSTGYALATGIPVIHADSDLDLLIRAPCTVSPEAFTDWQAQLSRALCRADTQVDTPEGGFALAEWLRDGKTLLKRNMGRAGGGSMAQGGVMKILFTFPAGHTA